MSGTGSLTVVTLTPPGVNIGLGRDRVATTAGLVAFWWTVGSLVAISIAYNTAWYNAVTEPRPLLLALVGGACLAVVIAARPTMPAAIVAALFAGVVALPEFTGWLQMDPAIPAIALPVAAVVLSGAFSTTATLLRHTYWAAVLVVWLSFVLLGLIGLGLRASVFFTGNDRPLLGWGQFRGVLVHPNVLGIVALIGLLIGVGMAVTSRRFGWRLLFGPGACALALVLTGSRSTLLAAAVTLPLILWPRVRDVVLRWSRVLAVTIPVLVALVPLAAVSLGLYLEARLRPWQLATEAWRDHRILGYGPELMSDSYWQAPGAPRYPDAWYPTHAHNIFLNSVGLGGLLAGIVLLAAIGMAVYLAATSRLSPTPLAVIIAVVVTGTFDTVLGRTEIPTTFLPLLLTAGVVAAAMATHRRPEPCLPRLYRGEHLTASRWPSFITTSTSSAGTAGSPEHHRLTARQPSTPTGPTARATSAYS